MPNATVPAADLGLPIPSDVPTAPRTPRPKDIDHRAWAAGVARMYDLMGRLESARSTGSDDVADALLAELEAAQKTLLFTPAPDADGLSVKFTVFREIFGNEPIIYPDRREFLFLAAIEADALRLADTLDRT